MITRLILIGGVWFAACWQGIALASMPDFRAERTQYEQALNALARGDQKRFGQLQQSLRDYPLQPYLHYADLKRRLNRAAPTEVRNFLKANDDSPISGLLRARWLRQLGKRKRWTDYLADYTPQRSADLRCYWYRARLQRGQRADYDRQSQSLWLTGKSQHDACNPLFDHWRRSGQLSEAAYSERAELAVKAGNPRLARYLSRKLPAWRRAEIQRWIDLRANRPKLLRQAKSWKDTEFHRTALTHELNRAAKRDNELANQHWLVLKDRFRWLPEQRISIEQNLALFYATEYPTDALARLQALPANARNQQLLEWTIRVAISDGDWQAVEDAWQQLDNPNKAKPRWRYWRARALEALGHNTEAGGLFASLATETNFHGFLSADRLSQPYVICPATTALVDADKLAASPGLQRAFELFKLRELGNARREWNAVVRQLDGAGRVQAALLADREGWHNRAILTLADEGQLKEYTARFPLAWQSLFDERAKWERLDPSLVIAVARSESALMTDAISSAGARGLMQLTPDTGRRVAKVNKWRRPSNWDLLQPTTNIRLGSAYLDQLFDRFQHPALVLGAYNAGPHVVDRWLKMDLPNESDRWIESLPYHETRDYIPRVIAFATIYDWRRTGKMQRVSSRLPGLRSKPARLPDSVVEAVCVASTLAGN